VFGYLRAATDRLVATKSTKPPHDGFAVATAASR
jgi:hypothetical protein